MAAEAEEAARSQLATVTIQEACPQCGEEIDEDEGDGDAAETLVRAEGRTFHKSCFVCAECLVSLVGRPFIGHEGRNYCERDYASLFAPRCGACGEPILGRCVTALELPWHPDCFACKMCGKALTSGYVKRKGMALCAACNREEQEAHLRADSCGPKCARCQEPIEAETAIRMRGQLMHPYHFKCSACRDVLDETAIEYAGKLYCPPCKEKLDSKTCAACRKPIAGIVVEAMGQYWHAEHFVCAKCERPFAGGLYKEHQGRAYCERHYRELHSECCFACGTVVGKDSGIRVMLRAFCTDHFRCAGCGLRMLDLGSRYREVDMRPFCKKCFKRLPTPTRRKLALHLRAEQKRLKALASKALAL